jgi:hypothetical protein
MGGPHLSAREGGRGEEGRPRGGLGRGKKELGRAEQKERSQWAGPCGRRGKSPVWAGPQGRKERGKKKRESGLGPIRKGGTKRIAFKCI